MSSNNSVPKRSVIIDGRRTSISLEEIFFDELKLAAQKKAISVNELVTSIDAERAKNDPDGNLSSAVRVYLFRAALAENQNRKLKGDAYSEALGTEASEKAA